MRYLSFFLLILSFNAFSNSITIFESEDIFLTERFCLEKDGKKCLSKTEVTSTLERILLKRGFQNASCKVHNKGFRVFHYGVVCSYNKPLIEGNKCYKFQGKTGIAMRSVFLPTVSVIGAVITGASVLSETVRLDLITISKLTNIDYFDLDRDPFKTSKSTSTALNDLLGGLFTGNLKLSTSCDSDYVTSYDFDKEIDTTELNLKDALGPVTNRDEGSVVTIKN